MIFFLFTALLSSKNADQGETDWASALTLDDFRYLNASAMLMLGIPDKYAIERGGWASNDVLKSVYQHTFSAERKQVDERIDGFFNNLLRG